MAKEAANNLVETSDYIGHHLVNLTFGWCEKTSSWGFAHHQQDLSKSLDSACDVSEMGFWAFHMDTIFMSVFWVFWSLVSLGSSTDLPKKELQASCKTLLNLFTNLSVARCLLGITELQK